MEGAGVGRAIYPGATPPPPTEFHAKEEPAEAGLAAEIRALGLSDVRVIASPGERMLYSRDQSEIPRFLRDIMFNAQPEVVVQPRSRESVAAVLRLAKSKGVTVIPRGSGSSPFGGSVPVSGGIVLDLSGMDRIFGLDSSARTVTVQAGTRWADLDHFLEKNGLSLYTSPSSKFSTVGGWVATGGMGLNSFSMGHLSKCVTAIEIVTSDGLIRTLTPDDAEFAALFGSEGQLGAITAVTLRAREIPEKSRPHIVFFDDTASALSFANALAASSVRPVHIVFESSSKFSLINQMLGSVYFRVGDAILVNIEGDESERSFQEFLRHAGLKEEKEFLARYMWNERFFPMKIRKFGPGMLGAEVVVPLTRMADALKTAKDLCNTYGLDPLFEIHFLDDGRGLLLCFYVTDQGNTIRYTLDAVKSMLITSRLLEVGAKPYSIGIWNHPFSNAEDRTKMESLRKAKAALDPGRVMNTGKMFSLSGRFGGIAGMAFNPRLMRPLLKTMVVFSPITSSAMKFAYDFANKRLRPKTRTDLLRVADECAMCGACVSVCPAYLIVRDERVTARGKLLTAKAMARGAKISKEHAHRTFLCMRCKACEQVCQSKLELITAYDALEKELEEACGKDAAEIEKFIRYAESTSEYDELVLRGLVIGAPRHGMGGASADV